MGTKNKKQIIHTNRPYKFRKYDPHWVKLFEDNAKILKEVFGDEIILLEHVGSTSIPDMWAKPQIDILITVKNFGKVPEFYEEMKKHGFTAHGDYTNEGEEYFTKDTPDGNREVSVHVLPVGHAWAADLLNFRDYLRSHPEEMQLYSNTKKQMNEQFPSDYTNYYKGKLETVHLLRKRAAQWRGHKI